MGNLAKEDALKLKTQFDELSKAFSRATVEKEKVEWIEPVVRPSAPFELRKANPRKGDPNHVTVVSVMTPGIPDVKDRVVWGILGMVLEPLAYETLRTQKQLGYVVQGGV